MTSFRQIIRAPLENMMANGSHKSSRKALSCPLRTNHIRPAALTNRFRVALSDASRSELLAGQITFLFFFLFLFPSYFSPSFFSFLPFKDHYADGDALTETRSSGHFTRIAVPTGYRPGHRILSGSMTMDVKFEVESDRQRIVTTVSRSML